MTRRRGGGGSERGQKKVSVMEDENKSVEGALSFVGKILRLGTELY